MNGQAEDVSDLMGSPGQFRRVRPDFPFMKPRLSRWLALGCGSGLAPVAPGTFGTLFAWVTFAALRPLVGDTGLAVLVVAGFLAGIWAIDRVGYELRVIDHPAIVWDEVVAFWLVLLLVPAGFGSQFMAFVLFRWLDIVKPPPAGKIDREMKSAVGVMLDDLVAAGYTVLVFAVFTRIF